MKPLELHPLAVAEGEEAAAWYAERDPRVAARFGEELEATLGLIVEAPDRWPIYLGMRRALFRRFPYFILYRDEPQRILVVVIAHAKRRPGYCEGR